MTAKRFECLGFGEYWDNQEDYGLEPKEVTELLNSLNDENEQLKYQNEMLSDELEQCKAVINKEWSKYLKKKEKEELEE